MTQQDNVSIVRSMYDASNQKNFDQLKALGSSTTEWLEVPFNQVFKGQNAVHDNWKGWVDVFPDANIEVRNLVSAGDYVISECIGRGTHRGVFRSPIGDLQPTGNKVEIPFSEIVRLRDGKIISAHSYFDFYSFIRQLKLEVKPAKAA